MVEKILREQNFESHRGMPIDAITVQISEALARLVSRRVFVKRVGSGAFLIVAGWAAGLGQARALFNRQLPCCTPPGPYCNLDGNGQEPNGCQGANCFENLDAGLVLTCAISSRYFAAGCWTTHCGD